MGRLPAASQLDDKLQLVTFVDYGKSVATGGASADRELSSAGTGLRYRIGTHANLRLDYAWQLDGGGSRAHFGLDLEF